MIFNGMLVQFNLCTINYISCKFEIKSIFTVTIMSPHFIQLGKYNQLVLIRKKNLVKIMMFKKLGMCRRQLHSEKFLQLPPMSDNGTKSLKSFLKQEQYYELNIKNNNTGSGPSLYYVSTFLDFFRPTHPTSAQIVLNVSTNSTERQQK